jgi:hypothetical protein
MCAPSPLPPASPRHASPRHDARAPRFAELCLDAELTYLFAVRENYYASYFSISCFRFFWIVGCY